MLNFPLFILFYLTISITLGIVNNYFIRFIDWCFNEGNIFSNYYIFLLEKVKPVAPNLSKVMGLCIVCFGFWFNIVLFFFYYKIFLIPTPIFIIPYLGVSQWLLIKFLS